MKIKKVFCMFEQSGTFKNAFLAHGIEAEDFDILNDFGQTDHIVDLFAEINKAYNEEPSIFDEIGQEDLCLAFFPCTRFECHIPLAFRGEANQQRNWSDTKKLNYSMRLHEELHALYILICKLFQISLRGGWRLIVENPYNPPHYLTMFFPIKPKLIIKDRYLEGDYYKKPTQFFFVNCEPSQNVVFEPVENIKQIRIEHINEENCINSDFTKQVQRSLIHPQFVERFIKTYILDKEGGIWLPEEKT